MTCPVKYRHGCGTNAPAVRIFHGASCKGALRWTQGGEQSRTTKDAKHKQAYKFEARNPKQIKITEISMTKTKGTNFRCLEFQEFELRYCFGFRYSKFGFFSLRSLRLCSGQAWRPFGGVYPDKGRAQDRLGAKIFVEVVLFRNFISKKIIASDL